MLLIFSACGGSSPTEIIDEVQEVEFSHDEIVSLVYDIATGSILGGSIRGDDVFVSYEIGVTGRDTIHIGVVLGENDYPDALLRSVAASHAVNITESLLNQHYYLNDYWDTVLLSVYGVGTAIRIQSHASTNTVYFHGTESTYRYFDYMDFFDDFNFDFDPLLFDVLFVGD